MSDLKSADEIIEEYPKPNSTVDNGNLFFACTTYQSAYKKLQAQLTQERERRKSAENTLRYENNLEAIIAHFDKYKESE